MGHGRVFLGRTPQDYGKIYIYIIIDIIYIIVIYIYNSIYIYMDHRSTTNKLATCILDFV